MTDIDTSEYEYIAPERTGIIAEYTTNDFGYLLQHLEDGTYRYIAVEAGEEDLFGEPQATRQAALLEAVTDWKINGLEGIQWEWLPRLKRDATAAPKLEVEDIAGLLTRELGPTFSEAELSALATKLFTAFATAQA